MTPDSIFTICNNGVIPAWLLLAFAPTWSWTQRIVHQIWIPVLLGSVYLGVMVTSPESPAGGGFSSLSGVILPWWVGSTTSPSTSSSEHGRYATHAANRSLIGSSCPVSC